ncbi:hypothetical protein BV898_13668 [Hypsibius exemplaris]|uniref:Uncharacterized protein n=1 Tax=Hypsibius exemplaris TaxID=2072580 RepID=A0A1W0W9Z2_HYPEX|nr:hypothetical protein BV898_13668 [Hypsibius exemplaris]
MALIARIRIPQSPRAVSNNPHGDAPIPATDRDLEAIFLPGSEMGHGDGPLSRLEEAESTGLFFQVMRQIALDFSIIEYYARNKVVLSEEMRLQERLLQEIIRATMAMLFSTILWLLLFLAFPRICVAPLAPFYSIVCISQCFIGRLIWSSSYQGDIVRRRMEPVQDRLRAERANLTRRIEALMFGNVPVMQ